MFLGKGKQFCLFGKIIVVEVDKSLSCLTAAEHSVNIY